MNFNKFCFISVMHLCILYIYIYFIEKYTIINYLLLELVYCHEFDVSHTTPLCGN